MFNDRREAGMLLALRLKKYKSVDGVVLAVPRGGVPVAYEVAKELNLPLEVIMVKKLGHPLNKEYAIGAVGLNEVFIVPHEDVSDFYIRSETANVRSTLRRMKKKFMEDKEPEDLRGKTVIVIDDGIATGNTLLATIKILKKSRPAKIVIAVPVISKSALQKLTPEVDELITVLIPHTFYGVGAFYHDFGQLSDEDVMEYLDRLQELKQSNGLA
jgi:putative phosphoribosyl transferase